MGSNRSGWELTIQFVWSHTLWLWFFCILVILFPRWQHSNFALDNFWIYMQMKFIAELRAKRARGAPWVNKSTHPRKFGNHVTDRPSVRTTGIPMFTLTLSSYFESPGESWLHINVVINWQLSKQGIRWPVSSDRIAGSGVDPSRSSIFFRLPVDNLVVFKWSQAHVYFFV